MITITQTLASNVIYSVYNPMVVRLTSDVSNPTLRIKATVKKISDNSVLGTLTAFKVLGEFRFDFSNLLKAFVPKIGFDLTSDSGFVECDETVLSVDLVFEELILNEFSILEGLDTETISGVIVTTIRSNTLLDFHLFSVPIKRSILNGSVFPLNVANISNAGEGLSIVKTTATGEQTISSVFANLIIRGNYKFVIELDFYSLSLEPFVQIEINWRGQNFVFVEDKRDCNGIKTLWFRTSLGGFDLYNFAKVSAEMPITERSSYETYNQDDSEKHTQIDYYSRQSNITTVESQFETDERIEYLSKELLTSTEVYLVEGNGNVITPINIVSTSHAINHLGLNKMTLQYKTKDFINY